MSTDNRTDQLQLSYASTARWRTRVATALAVLWYATVFLSLFSFALVVMDDETPAWTAGLAPWAPFALLATGTLAQYLSKQQALYEVTAHRLTYLSRVIRDSDEGKEGFYRRLLAEGSQVGAEFIGGRHDHRKQLQDELDHGDGGQQGDPA